MKRRIQLALEVYDLIIGRSGIKTEDAHILLRDTEKREKHNIFTGGMMICIRIIFAIQRYATFVESQDIYSAIVGFDWTVRLVLIHSGVL